MKITKDNYKEVIPEKEQALILALLQDLDEYYFPRWVEIHYQDWHNDNDEYPDYYGTYSIRWSNNSNENINSEMTINELDMNMCTLCQAFEQLHEMEKNDNPEEDKKKITKDELDVYLTCKCCPEQYDVYLGDNNIGYIRLRHGRLTCEYLPNGKLDDSTVLVLLKDFEGDEYKGSFDTDDERSEYLDRCKQALADYYNRPYK